MKALWLLAFQAKNSKTVRSTCSTCRWTGMLLGGLIWGVLGDMKGRVSVLFGSIFLYSAANIANAFVTSIDQYAFWRFMAGLWIGRGAGCRDHARK
jgi:MFS family permease